MSYRSPLNRDNFEKYTKQTAELKIAMIKLLPLFNSKKGWADIERTLQKILLHLRQIETPYIFQKPILFRSLSQCLNLKEEGIHQTVFEIYERILEILQKNGEFLMNDIFFLTSGLFIYLQNNLYQQNKRIYKLIIDYVLPLKEQIGPMVPALIASLFPALIENNQYAEKTVYDILYKLKENLPQPFFYGSIWLVLFRSPSSRFGILKFMLYHLGQLQKQNLEVFDDEFQAENQIVPPKGPEFENFMESQLPVGEYLHPENRLSVRLTTGDFPKRDSLPREDHDNELVPEITPDLGETIQEMAQESPTEKFIQPTEDQEKDRVEEETALLTAMEGKLTQEFRAVEETDFNEYEVFKEYCRMEYNEWSNYIQTNCQNTIYPNKDITLAALTSALADDNNIIVQKTLDFLIVFLSLKSGILSENENIIIIKSCLSLLDRAEYPIKRRIFKFIFSNFSEDESDEVMDDYAIALIIKSLKALFEDSIVGKSTKVFKIMQTIFMEREVLIEPLITGFSKSILNLLAILDEPNRQEFGTKFFMSISTYYYLFLTAYIEQNDEMLCEKELLVLTRFGKEHTEFVFEANPKNEKIPADIQKYHQSILSNNYEKPNTSLIIQKTSVLGISSLVFETGGSVFDNEENDMEFEGNNVSHLVRMKIFEGYLKLIRAKPFESEDPLKNMLDITKQWPDLHLTTKLTQLAHDLLQIFKESLNAEVFGKMDDQIFEQILRVSAFLLHKLNDNPLINAWATHLETFLNKHTNNPLYCLASIRGITEFITSRNSDVFKKLNEAAIKSSWRLMDDLRFHNSAFILINELGKSQLKLMLEILNTNMRDEEVIVRIDCLQRIIIFWKVAASQIETYNIELDENLTCILLDHVEDNHPVLRQLAKSWLFDSSAYLDRILDPVVRKMIINCRLFVTVSGRFFHVNIFNTVQVMTAFKRLKIIVSNNASRFGQFVLNNPPSKIVSDLLEQNQDDDRFDRNTYSDILIGLGIRFLRADVLPFMGRRFRQDNLLISTASCELLEEIIKIIQISNPNFLSEWLVELLLKSYYQFVTDGISVMQVNMINLMKVILFQTGFLERNKRNLGLFERIFREKKLLENVINSIKNNQNSHTLLKIVDFLDTTIEIFSSGFFPENKLKDVVSLVFESYFMYITEASANEINKTTFDSIVVLIEAVFKLIEKYLNLEDFEIPDQNQPKKSIFLRIISFGLYTGKKKTSVKIPFKLIEAYFMEYFDKIMIVLLKGWKFVSFPVKEYKFCNLGPFGYNDIYAEIKSTRPVEELIAETATPIKDEESAPEYVDSKLERVSINDREQAEAQEQSADPFKIEKINTKIQNNQDDQLIIMTEKMYYKYPTQFVDSLIKAWVASNVNLKPENAKDLNIQQAKIIDLITYFKFSISDFKKMIQNSEIFKENQLKNKRKKATIISYSSGTFECSILALYYGFLKYKVRKFIDDNHLRKQELRDTWHSVCDFLQEFTKSTHPQVDLWVINIYHLCAKKFPTQEIIHEYSIKKLIHVHENIVLEKIVAFICEDSNSKLGFEKAGDSEFFGFVFPLPTLVVDLSFEFGSLYLSKLTSKFEEDFHLRYYTKIISLKSLKLITMELLKMTYENKSNDRIAKRVHNIIIKLFIYIESLLKNKLAINENLYVEIIEYMFIFLEDSRDFLMNAFQGPIEKFFDSDLFFECPSKSLVLWSKIIYWQSNQANKKILTKYLYKLHNKHELFLAFFLPIE